MVSLKHHLSCLYYFITVSYILFFTSILNESDFSIMLPFHDNFPWQRNGQIKTLQSQLKKLQTEKQDKIIDGLRRTCREEHQKTQGRIKDLYTEQREDIESYKLKQEEHHVAVLTEIQNCQQDIQRRQTDLVEKCSSRLTE